MTSTRKLETVRMSDVEPKPVEWVWPRRIPRGKLSMLSGEPGLGKSTITLDIAARVTRGTGWPDAPEETRDPGYVLLLTAEDDLADTVRPRLDAAGADVGKVFVVRSVKEVDEAGKERSGVLALAKDLDLIDEALHSLPFPELIIIDPASAYFGGSDTHRNSDIREVLAPLKELAEFWKVAILLVNHLNKGAGQKAMHRSLGSIGFVAAVRSAYLIAADEADKGRALMLPVKSNLAPCADGLAYRIVETEACVPRIEWEADPVTISADEALRAGEDRDREVDEAAAWLRVFLQDGPKLSKEVWEASEAEGFSRMTVRRAKPLAGAKCGHAKAFQGPWAWSLNGHDPYPPE